MAFSGKVYMGLGKWLIEIPNVLQCYNGILNRESIVTDNSIAHHGISGFAALYEEYMTYVFRYINYRVGNRSEAEDLTSVVFEKALASFQRYNSQKAAPQTWLLTIARNTVTDYFRKSSKRDTIPLETALGIESDDPSPQEKTERREEYEQLRVCLAKLPQREQEIISLKFGAELNNRQIASVLSLSENNVGTILFRAICKLRNCYKDELNEKG